MEQCDNPNWTTWHITDNKYNETKSDKHWNISPKNPTKRKVFLILPLKILEEAGTYQQQILPEQQEIACRFQHCKKENVSKDVK